jgi:basic amino acid/polyamine antiporter, APA family
VQQTQQLERRVTLFGATTLNMIDMIGVGPFITIPLIIAAMGGPQAMLGWIFGALLAICDGLVWAELGAAMPKSGGSYEFLKHIYGPRSLGRLLSFLFIFQLSFSAPLSIASGCVGLAQYATYLAPSLSREFINLHVNVFGVSADLIAGGVTLVAIGALAVCVMLLYRRIDFVTRIGNVLWVVVMGTIAWIIFAGITHFDSARAFSFPANAFHIDHNFFLGLGAAMLVATYDYWGYYNVCFIGEEIEQPERNIPRAMIYSILAVGAIYIVMNISILGVIPWQELAASAESNSRLFVISTMMERLYGHGAAVVATLLIMWTAFASVFSLLLGYSRVPFAAARDGNYFAALARVHPKLRIPHVSLLVLAGVAVLACFLRLGEIIAALVVIRISLQFLMQTVGLLILRAREPEAPRPFRMWLYPVPAVLSLTGFVYVLISRKGFTTQLKYAAAIALLGLAVYLVRAYRSREWPFRAPDHIEETA